MQSLGIIYEKNKCLNQNFKFIENGIKFKIENIISLIFLIDFYYNLIKYFYY